MRAVLETLRIGEKVRKDKVFDEEQGRWTWEFTACGVVVREEIVRDLQRGGWIRPLTVGEHVEFELTEEARRVLEAKSHA